MKTADLAGPELDHWVAKAEGHEATFNEHRCVVHRRVDGLSLGHEGSGWIFAPSKDWKHGGPIIERERIGLEMATDDPVPEWQAHKQGATHKEWRYARGAAPLVAAMRVYVASKFGDEAQNLDYVPSPHPNVGPSALAAVIRAYADVKFGEEVPE